MYLKLYEPMQCDMADLLLVNGDCYKIQPMDAEEGFTLGDLIHYLGSYIALFLCVKNGKTFFVAYNPFEERNLRTYNEKASQFVRLKSPAEDCTKISFYGDVVIFASKEFL